MKITEVDAKQEMQILAALVYNDKVLAGVVPYIDREAFQSRYSFKIAEKCRRYFEKYHKAPRTHIHDYLSSQIENSENREETESLQRILDNLTGLKVSVNGKKSNDKYLIDRSLEYIEKMKFTTLLSQARIAADSGALDKAKELTNRLNRLSVDSNGHVWSDPFTDTSKITSVLAEKEKPLISFPGALGKFFGRQLDRNNFVSFMGPEKSFKSFWLQEILYRGLRNQLKVMFFGIGDMSEDEYYQRIYTRICARPVHKMEYLVPIGWKSRHEGMGCNLPKFKKKRTLARMTVEETRTAQKRFCNKYLGSAEIGRHCRIFAVSEISLQEIETKLKRHQDLDSWSPDILVIDYADRLNPPKGIQEKIQQVDHNWNKLRAMALDHRMLVVTATQVKRTGYKGRLQSRDDVADSKGKTAVVTGLIGINSFPEEYVTNTRRLNWVVCREHTQRTIVSVAACPAIGNPCVIST